MPTTKALASKSKSAPPAEKTKSSAQPPAVTAFNPVWGRLAWGIQPKLAVSAPGDPDEREADRIADTVMRMPEPVVQRSCTACSAGGAICPSCEEEEHVQRKADGVNGAGEVGSDFASHLGGGAPLDADSRAFFEPRFGRDFGDVRVHTGPEAAAVAGGIQARAFAFGRDIVFSAREYAPGSVPGKHLLAHELTHVVQQSGRTGPTLQRQPINNTPADVDAVAAEVEALVRPKDDEKGALEKLNALDMRDLLAVVEKLYNDGRADEPDEGKRRAYALLNGDLTTQAGEVTKTVNVPRLKAAFDAAPARKLRNPTKNDPGTTPTLSGYRDRSKTGGPVRPGDWGEDPAGNTWVAHAEGIRTYFGTSTPGKARSSAWLGNNPGNADYVKALTKRAIGSFHWGKGVHHFAIYFSIADASADLRDRIKVFATIRSYIEVHLGNNPADHNEGADVYITNMRQTANVTGDDSPSLWTRNDAKWAELIEGFKSAEHWQEGTTLTTANAGTISSDPKDAAVVAYYQGLLGNPPGRSGP